MNEQTSQTQNHMARLGAGALFVFTAAALRVVPHLPNFTPIAAMALFGGAYFDRKIWAIGLPLVAMILSDMVLGFHSLIPVIYGSFVLVAVLDGALKKHRSPLSVGAASVGASLIFFVVTNLAVWFESGMYPHSPAGVAECFVAAVPFFNNELLGDLFYSGFLFGAWAIVERLVPSLAETKAS